MPKEKCCLRVKMGFGMVLRGRDGAKEKMGPNGMTLPLRKGDPWELGREILKVGRWEKNCFWGVKKGLGSGRQILKNGGWPSRVRGSPTEFC
jgi:hypothetical protein